MLNCYNVPDKPDYFIYIFANFDPVNKVVWLDKYIHFKKGDFYRTKNQNGRVSEVEITDIHDDGFIEIIQYDTMRWHDGRKMHKRGKHTHCVTLASLWAEDIFFDIQNRGAKFHKIKHLSKKHNKIKVHYDIHW